MTPDVQRKKFPQMDPEDGRIKYCSVFYEGQHDDARTNLAIAQTAAREGASIASYCNVVKLLRKDGDKGKVIGAEIKDMISGETFKVKAKSVMFCGGPFTDELRKLEDKNSKDLVNGAAGIHVVINATHAPKDMGMLDMATSDGRFLFYLPWEGHVLVGTTDHKQKASMKPEASEKEIAWVLNEASKYLAPEWKLKREDVLSSWCGIRPLTYTPSAKNEDGKTSTASRDHSVAYNAESGIVYVTGGKWVTYREM
jgi:glycerol-3-phosphate dehydrogenase